MRFSSDGDSRLHHRRTDGPQNTEGMGATVADAQLTSRTHIPICIVGDAVSFDFEAALQQPAGVTSSLLVWDHMRERGNGDAVFNVALQRPRFY